MVANSHQINQQRLNKRVRSISLLALMAFLCAFFAHSEHIAEQTLVFDQQECHICHQGVDTPPKAIQLAHSPDVSFIPVSLFRQAQGVLTPYNGQPRLRAPPQV